MNLIILYIEVMNKLKRYTIKYIDTSDDLTSVWVEASSKADAKSQVKREYWDIKEIIMVTES